MMNFVNLIYAKFYRTNSSGDLGKMYNLRNKLDQRNVFCDTNKNYRACNSFLQDVLDGYVIACALHHFGMRGPKTWMLSHQDFLNINGKSGFMERSSKSWISLFCSGNIWNKIVSASISLFREDSHHNKPKQYLIDLVRVSHLMKCSQSHYISMLVHQHATTSAVVVAQEQEPPPHDPKAATVQQTP